MFSHVCQWFHMFFWGKKNIASCEREVTDPIPFCLWNCMVSGTTTQHCWFFRKIGIAHYRDCIYCNTWTWNVTPFTVKRDSENIIDCKTRRVPWFLNGAYFMLSRVYYWLQNAIQNATMDNCIQISVYQTPSPSPPLTPLISVDTLVEYSIQRLNCDCIDNCM